MLNWVLNTPLTSIANILSTAKRREHLNFLPTWLCFLFFVSARGSKFLTQVGGWCGYFQTIYKFVAIIVLKSRIIYSVWVMFRIT